MRTYPLMVCGALALLSASDVEALRSKLNVTHLSATTDIVKVECGDVMADLQKALDEVIKNKKVGKTDYKVRALQGAMCSRVFGSGAVAAWAALLQTKNRQNIVVKKINFAAPHNGVSGYQQYENEWVVLYTMSKSSWKESFPAYKGGFDTDEAGYIMMEYVDGEDCCASGYVQEKLREAPKKTAGGVMLMFARAIYGLASNYWSQGDHNGMNAKWVEGKNELKLFDFGMVKSCSKDSTPAEQTTFIEKLRDDVWTAWYWSQKAGLLGGKQMDDFEACKKFGSTDTDLPTNFIEARTLALTSLAELGKLIREAMK